MPYRFANNCQFEAAVLNGIYEDAFGLKADGAFVEVGASNGRDYSNTSGLADIGWRGIYIEPVKGLAMECYKTHAANPKITVLNAAAGDVDNDDAEAWIIPKWGTATLSRSAAVACSTDLPRQMRCQMLKLDTILDARGWPSTYDLLVIDVDFGEVQVLKGYTIARWKPKLVIIELHEESGHPLSADARAFAPGYFEAAGYERIYKDGINSVFRLK